MGNEVTIICNNNGKFAMFINSASGMICCGHVVSSSSCRLFGVDGPKDTCVVDGAAGAFWWPFGGWEL